MSTIFDAIIVGSGPNGLAAAITLQRRGLRTLILEGSTRAGGGLHTAEVTLPGFQHDICSAIHALGVSSPFFASIDLRRFGLEWVYSPAEVAQPLDEEREAVLYRDIERTAEQFGADAQRYRDFITPFVDGWSSLQKTVLGPPSFPAAPVLAARFGIRALRSAENLAKQYFSDERLGAMIAGLAGHSVRPLDSLGTAAFAILFAVSAHTGGWPFPKGGAERLAEALLQYYQECGGECRLGYRVSSLSELPPHRVALFDLTPREFLRIAGPELTPGYRRELERYRYGPGIFKIDYALDGPAPFLAPGCREAATVHLGGSFDEVAAAEKLVAQGRVPERPFVLYVQTSPFDTTRAPEGKHTGWAYAHVPNGSNADITDAIENQIERFAPGFRDRVLARAKMTCHDFETLNPNYAGGDINGGSMSLRQLFFRPTISLRPYRTSKRNVYLCSAATPPGSGIHGMCGYHAASLAIREHFR